MGFEKSIEHTERIGHNLDTANKASEYKDVMAEENKDDFLESKEEQYKKYEHTKGEHKGKVSAGGFIPDDQIIDGDTIMEEEIDNNEEATVHRERLEGIAEYEQRKNEAVVPDRQSAAHVQFTEKNSIKYNQPKTHGGDPEIKSREIIENKPKDQKYEKAA